MICLDTNIVIALLKQDSVHLLERFMQHLPQGAMALSTIVLFELYFGIANSQRRQENADRLAIFLQAPIAVLPFGPEDAEAAGELRAELKQAGTPIGPYDLLIAAQARRRGALLVTANTEEFARVNGLKIENWATV